MVDGSPPHSPPRLPALTGIRGVAALWVVMFHAIQISWLYNAPYALPGHAIAMSGWAGVDLFFVLSGFTLMHAHQAQFQRLTIRECLRFYVARVFRVYPLSMFVLFLFLGLLSIDPAFKEFYARQHHDPQDVSSFLSTMSLTSIWFSNSDSWNGPIWSLSAEIVGYVFFPFAAYASSRLLSPGLCIVLALLCIVVLFSYEYGNGLFGDNAHNFIPAMMRMSLLFFAGILLRCIGVLRPFAPGLPALAVLCVIGVGLCMVVPHSGGFITIPLALLVFSLSDQRGVVSAVLSHRVLVFLGKGSFPIYLLHTLPLFAFHYYAGGANRLTYNLGLIALIVILLLISWFLHQAIELPSHRLARRIMK